MNNLLQLLLLSPALLFIATAASASEPITINPTARAPLFDGRCEQDEWQAANSIELPAGVVVYLMHDEHSLYVCASGKAEDYAVIDLYIEHTGSGNLHNLHASAQLVERVFEDEAWSESDFWNQQDWSGFWVPYAGNEDTDEGTRPKFLQGSHREIQVLRKKFPGDTWNLMIGISAIKQEGNFGPDIFYPVGAVDTDKSTWAAFTFSD